MFKKAHNPYEVVLLPDVPAEEKEQNPVSTPGMQMASKVEVQEDFELQVYRTKKVNYGQKDIEV